MFSRKLIPLAVLGLLSAASFTAGAANIDTFNFDPGQSNYSYANYAFPQGPGNLPISNTETNASAIGGVREVGIVAPSNLGVTIDADVTTPGQLSVSNNTGVSSTTYVLWDNGGGGFGGQDLTDGNSSDALLISITAIDQGNTTLTFDIIGTGVLGTASMTLNNLGVGVHKFLFTGFTNYSSNIFTNVDAIRLTIGSTAGSDLSLDLVETNSFVVPEPATLTLLGAGLLGIGTLRKKRNG
jgi:hypothetical protein